MDTIRSDDGVKLWLNGELVHQNNLTRGLNPGEDKADVTLNEGWNTCLMKITQGTGGWQATLCICNEKGKSMDDLKYK